MSPRARRRTAILALLLALGGAGVLALDAARRRASDAPTAPRGETRAVALGALPAGEPAEGLAVPAAPLGLVARFAPAPAPGEDPLVRLLSPFPAAEECLDRCPPTLRLVAGAEGRAGAAEALAALEPALRGLAGQPGLPAETAAALAGALDALGGATRAGRARAILVRGTTGLPAGASGTGLSVSDLYDPYFDARRAGRGGGVRILVNRVDGPGGAPLGGTVEVGGDGVGGGSGDADLGSLASMRHPLGTHFVREGLPVFGWVLAGGVLHAYGYWGEGLRALPADPALVRAVEAVLRVP